MESVSLNGCVSPLERAKTSLSKGKERWKFIINGWNSRFESFRRTWKFHWKRDGNFSSHAPAPRFRLPPYFPLSLGDESHVINGVRLPRGFHRGTPDGPVSHQLREPRHKRVETERFNGWKAREGEGFARSKHRERDFENRKGGRGKREEKRGREIGAAACQ